MEKYDSYKDSGVEWLGAIPTSWRGVKMKYLFRDYSEKNKPEETLLSVTQSQGVVPRDWVESRMVMPSGNLGSFKYIKKGDFAISLRSFEGGLEYCHHDGIISPAYTVLKLRDDLKADYYKWLLKSASFISEIQTSVVGIREGKNISYPELSYSLLPVPNPATQTAIATFLDRKTAQIDRAIAQKERLIALLRERKQIVIQQAVTKGLDPTVKMKDSGVEWIGEVPEGWEVKRLKLLISQLESGTSVNASESESAIGNDIGVLKTSAVYSYSFDPTQNKKVFKTDISRVKCPVVKGAIVISRMNAPGLVGASGLVEGTFNNLFLPDRLWQTVYNEAIEFDKVWLSKVLTLRIFRDEIDKISTGSSPSMKNITKGDFLNLEIPFPPVNEQSQISAFINSQAEKIVTGINLQNKQIAKLKEYRTVLIDAAVTGKIKVD